jgi:integrase
MAKAKRFRPPKVTVFRRENSPYWYVSWYFEGRRKKERTQWTNKAEADRYAKALTAKLRASYYDSTSLPRPKERMTLGDLRDHYVEEELEGGQLSDVTTRCQKNRVDLFVSAFGADSLAEDLTVRMVEEWKRGALKEHPRRRQEEAVRSSTTIHNILNAGRIMYRWGLRMEYIASFGWQWARLPKAKSHRKIRIPNDQIQRMLDGLDLALPIDRAIALACFCGLREADLSRLRWEDFDWDTGVAEVETRKNQTRVQVALPETLRQALERIKGEGPLAPRISAFRTWTKATSRLLKDESTGELGPGYSFKWFRHSLASALEEAQIGDATKRAMLGHSSRGTTTGYIHLTPEHLKRTLERLPWAFNGPRVVPVRTQPIDDKEKS